MDRTIWNAQSQPRTFDIVNDDHDTLYSLAYYSQDILGQTTTYLSGFAATPTGPATLTVNIAAGRIFQIAAADATSDGAIPQDLTNIYQQGIAAAQQITLATSGISSGQSRWSLVQAQFSQADSIRAGDPTGGLLFFYNAANPSVPFQGPGNDGETSNTVRKGLVTIQVINGASATIGSEVPPNPTSGWVPLYLIDLTFGQTQITSGEILTAGPSVGTNVPSNYTQAPFLAGLTNQHHKGIAGHAPQIDLTAEVKNILPLSNLPASNTAGGGISVLKLNAGNPNGSVAGNANVNSASDMCYDTTNMILYICTTTGTTSTAVWTSVTTGTSAVFNGGTMAGGTGTPNAYTIASTSPAGFSLTVGVAVNALINVTNTGAATLNVDATGVKPIVKSSGSGPIALTGGELVAGNSAVFNYLGSAGYELVAQGLGSAAYKTASGSGTYVASVSGSITATHLAVFSDTNGTVEDGGAAGALANLGISGNSGLNDGSGGYAPAVFKQSSATTNKTFALADIGNLVLRSNSGTAMADTLPGTSGALPNGWTVLIKNTDATASDTISVGAGGTLNVGLNTGSFPILPGETWAIESQGSGVYNAGRVNSAVLHAAPPQSSFKNLKAAWASNTTFTMSADELIVEDSNGNTRRLKSVSVSINSATSGANGLDTGSIAANTLYAGYVIFNPTTGTIAGLISTSFSSPTLPSGYILTTGPINFSLTDGSSHFIGFIQANRNYHFVVSQNLTGLKQLASGTSGNTSSPTWTAVSIGSIIPTSLADTIDVVVQFNYVSNTQVMVAPNNGYGAYNSSSNPPPSAFGGPTGTSLYYANIVRMALESSNIYYASSDSGGAIYCYGCTLNI